MDLYYSPASAPCRSVQMLAKALGLNLNLKQLNLTECEHERPKFLKINPQHTIPTLVDDGFSIWESRAILIYLAEKYSDDPNLYPKEPKARAVASRLLFFDYGVLYQPFLGYLMDKLHNRPVYEDTTRKINEALGHFNHQLEGKKWATGDHYVIADFTLAATVSTIELVFPDYKYYSNVVRWLETCKKELPGYEINQAGINVLKTFFK